MKTWTCRRQTAGSKCLHVNPSRKRNCAQCGKPRPARKRPAHMSALDLDYEGFIELNGGEFCKLCGRGPKTRRLQRDHDHTTGKPRGLLCPRCNRALPNWITADWLRAAANYLDRTAGGEVASSDHAR